MPSPARAGQSPARFFLRRRVLIPSSHPPLQPWRALARPDEGVRAYAFIVERRREDSGAPVSGRIDLGIAEALHAVIVHHAHGLHEGVADG